MQACTALPSSPAAHALQVQHTLSWINPTFTEPPRSAQQSKLARGLAFVKQGNPYLPYHVVLKMVTANWGRKRQLAGFVPCSPDVLLHAKAHVLRPELVPSHCCTKMTVYPGLATAVGQGRNTQHRTQRQHQPRCHSLVGTSLLTGLPSGLSRATRNRP